VLHEAPGLLGVATTVATGRCVSQKRCTRPTSDGGLASGEPWGGGQSRQDNPSEPCDTMSLGWRPDLVWFQCRTRGYFGWRLIIEGVISKCYNAWWEGLFVNCATTVGWGSFGWDDLHAYTIVNPTSKVNRSTNILCVNRAELNLTTETFKHQ
jgi:hypothetical protein